MPKLFQRIAALLLAFGLTHKPALAASAELLLTQEALAPPDLLVGHSHPDQTTRIYRWAWLLERGTAYVALRRPVFRSFVWETNIEIKRRPESRHVILTKKSPLGSTRFEIHPDASWSLHVFSAAGEILRKIARSAHSRELTIQMEQTIHTFAAPFGALMDLNFKPDKEKGGFWILSLRRDLIGRLPSELIMAPLNLVLPPGAFGLIVRSGHVEKMLPVEDELPAGAMDDPASFVPFARPMKTSPAIKWFMYNLKPSHWVRVDPENKKRIHLRLEGFKKADVTVSFPDGKTWKFEFRNREGEWFSFRRNHAGQKVSISSFPMLPITLNLNKPGLVRAHWDDKTVNDERVPTLELTVDNRIYEMARKARMEKGVVSGICRWVFYPEDPSNVPPFQPEVSLEGDPHKSENIRAIGRAAGAVTPTDPTFEPESNLGGPDARLFRKAS